MKVFLARPCSYFWLHDRRVFEAEIQASIKSLNRSAELSREQFCNWRL